MLDCWNEHPEDRPTFNELREKFSTLLLAGKEGLYIDLQVDEMKPYYVIKEDEEEQFKRRRADSASSEESTTSIERIVPRDRESVSCQSSTNPYVDEPGGTKQEETETLAHFFEEQEEHLYINQPVSRPSEGGEHLTGLGMSTTMLASDQPHHDAMDQRTSNPYVDAPVTALGMPTIRVVGEESEEEDLEAEKPEQEKRKVVCIDCVLKS